MKIIRRSDNQLVLRLYESGFGVVIISLLCMSFPGLTLYLGLSGVGIEVLTCEKIKDDRVDCRLEQHAYIGNKQFLTQPLPLVTQAEYRYTAIENDNSDDEGCDTDHLHDFLLVFADNTRQTLFETSVTVNCHRGNKGWIQKRVNAFNTFVSSETKTLEIVRDKRYAFGTIAWILVTSLLGVGGVLVFFFSPLRNTLVFDATERKIVHWNTTMLQIKGVSYPFSSIRSVEYTIEEDSDDDAYYRATILLNSGEFSLGQTSIEANLLPIVQEIAQFVGIPVKTIDQRRSKSAISQPTQESLDINQKAKELLDYHKILYSQRHELVEVKPTRERFPHVNLPFYDQMQAQLERHGFRWLVDLEDRTQTKADGEKNRTFIRVMLSSDQCTSAGIYTIATPPIIKFLQILGLVPNIKAIDLESALETGTFVVTSNLQGLDTSSDIPGIQRQRLAPKTPLPALINAHQQTLRRLTQTEQALRLDSIDDVITMQHHLQDRKNAYKQGLGYLDLQEIQRAATPEQEDAVAKLSQAIDKIKENEPHNE